MEGHAFKCAPCTLLMGTVAGEGARCAIIVDKSLLCSQRAQPLKPEGLLDLRSYTVVATALPLGGPWAEAISTSANILVGTLHH